jgi:hypothetical protein
LSYDDEQEFIEQEIRESFLELYGAVAKISITDAVITK